LPAKLEDFDVPKNEEEPYDGHWISHFAENVSTTSVSISVYLTIL
jgi:hypothetical protein